MKSEVATKTVPVVELISIHPRLSVWTETVPSINQRQSAAGINGINSNNILFMQEKQCDSQNSELKKETCPATLWNYWSSLSPFVRGLIIGIIADTTTNEIYWSFDGITTDLNNVYIGILVNDASYTPIVSNQPYIGQGRALSLLSSLNQYFLVSTPFLDLYSTSFTIELWIYSIINNTNDYGIFSQCQCSTCTNQCFYLIIRSFHLFVSFKNINLISNTILISNTWYHIAFIYDYNTKTQILYINGIQDNINLNPNSYQITSGSIEIGASTIGLIKNSFNGYIDNCKITLRAKSSIEILNDATLTAYYSFDLPYPNSDNGPNGLNGTLFNTGLVDGRVNQAINFTGQSSHFQAYGFYQIGYGVIQSKPFSVSLWINPPEYIPCAIIQMSPTLRSQYCRNLIGFLPTENSTSQIITEGSNYTSILGPEVILNTWTHISVTYSMINGLRLYIDGIYFDSTGSFPFEASGSIIYLQIGFSRWCTSYSISNAGYNGLVDEVYVHSRELSQTEINILANP
ncbi:unnamed protein product [Rotaria magnacalcarata]|uniref:LamG-like jellyroll fold domain-containing protein n=1 Tax=Rotaria magnacalcarata TaxID=392030 RepID=A0A816V1V6_9BILA|nr:unnamed protein product [Rotaria magnacalcarata]CAF4138887.1 unnamed protein product [Rotaria magnacalcarata]